MNGYVVFAYRYDGMVRPFRSPDQEKARMTFEEFATDRDYERVELWSGFTIPSESSWNNALVLQAEHGAALDMDQDLEED